MSQDMSASEPRGECKSLPERKKKQKISTNHQQTNKLQAIQLLTILGNSAENLKHKETRISKHRKN